MAAGYFKSGLALWLLAFFAAAAHAQNQAIYTDSLQNGWVDYSWATVNFNSASVVHSGANAISVTATNYQALFLHHAAFDSSVYTNLTFWINGGPAGGQPLQVQATLNGAYQTAYLLSPLPAGIWQQISIPLSALGVANQPTMDGFWIQSRTGAQLAPFYVDDIALIAGPPPTNFIVIDAAVNRHPISPDIYGLAYASNADLVALNCPVNRLGGNNTSRYNWQINADNKDNDYYFESIGYPSAVAGEVGDTFIASTKAAGAQPLITIPMLDWIAKLGSNRAKLASFSIAKYGAQTASDPYLPDAGNGILTNGTFVTGNDPNDADTPSTPAYQQGWVQHLTNQWNTATNGGVHYYILDNEHSIWHSTHRDVHPVGATMNEILGKMVAYSSMIKSVDPNALMVGPEEWGWSGYFYSGYDQQYTGLHGYSTYPDRAAHGNQDYLPWLLSQLYQTNLATGQRLLDVFSVHYYPQSGEFGNDVTPATQLLRNRSTRSLWDTNYVDASWINAVVQLIPRLKGWVATNYPGTKIAITEYNWGAEGIMNGATAQADILGIFGREGLDIATRWTTPTNTTPTYQAIKIYRNYDGRQSTFGDTSVSAAATDVDNVAAFAAQRTVDGALTLMVVNKSLSGTAPVVMNFTNFIGSGAAQVWHLNGTNGVITRLPDQPYSAGALTVSLVAPSVTLFVIPPRALRLQAGASRNDGRFEFWLNAEIGQTFILQSSGNLSTWTPVSTNTLSSSQFDFLLPATGSTQFYRAVLSP